ncbi:MAG: hypothetical protein HYZ75_19170 [Elusimicrobia bacterium]|nr:hypothetical protein [Elusimicrobiota bacterium]
MRAVLALALLAAPPAGAVDKDPNCYGAYSPEVGREWEVAQADWNAMCDKGYSASDALRQSQRSSMARCTARFSPYEGKGKLPSGESAAYCARGSSGRARLAERTGTAASKPAAAPPKPRKPGDARMGPLARALDQARAWKPDACLSGLYYFYDDTTFITSEEWSRARAAGRIPERGQVPFEEYSYYFDYPSRTDREVNGYRVSYGDVIDVNFCNDVKRMEGPDQTESPFETGFTDCIGSVPVDLGAAVDAAAKGGFALETPFKAYLARLPTGFFHDPCRGGLAKKPPVECSDLRNWDPAQLRRVTGRPMWILSASGRTAFVDALKGRLRYVTSGGVDFGTSDSTTYAEPCLEDPKAGDKFRKLSK